MQYTTAPVNRRSNTLTQENWQNTNLNASRTNYFTQTPIHRNTSTFDFRSANMIMDGDTRVFNEERASPKRAKSRSRSPYRVSINQGQTIEYVQTRGSTVVNNQGQGNYRQRYAELTGTGVQEFSPKRRSSFKKSAKIYTTEGYLDAS